MSEAWSKLDLDAAGLESLLKDECDLKTYGFCYGYKPDLLTSKSTERPKRLLDEEKATPLGLEPRMTEPKSVVLPLHHGAVVSCDGSNNTVSNRKRQRRLSKGRKSIFDF